MLFLTSPLLEVPHGFTLRTGGVSEGPLASLNLSSAEGDSAAHVEENLRRLSLAAGRSPAQLALLHQVHGDRVVRALAGARESADALWTDEPGGLWLGVKSADCVPVLLSSADGRRVAAVHSGWRGTALRVAAKAVEVLSGQGERGSTLRAAVGPCIQACCYEVGPELAQRFLADFGPEVVREGGRRPHLSLSAAVRATLLSAGLLPEWVDVQTACTACEPERFYSHRREGGRTGRHLAFIAPAPLS
ncbi:MAG: peptidoglycan editing factor PgeF [Myxococcaceae bacterium]